MNRYRVTRPSFPSHETEAKQLLTSVGGVHTGLSLYPACRQWALPLPSIPTSLFYRQRDVATPEDCVLSRCFKAFFTVVIKVILTYKITVWLRIKKKWKLRSMLFIGTPPSNRYFKIYIGLKCGSSTSFLSITQPHPRLLAGNQLFQSKIVESK